MHLTLYADFAYIDLYDNLIFKYFYPDPNNTKARLTNTVKGEKYRLPYYSAGFKVAVKGKIDTEIKSLIGTPVKIEVVTKHYKFNDKTKGLVEGYKLVLESITPHIVE